MSERFVNDTMGDFTSGADAGSQLVHRAVDLERKKFELQEKRVEVNANKVQIMANEVRNTMMLKGPMRQMQIEKVENLARTMDIPFSPMAKAYLNDENNYADLGTWLTTMSESKDNKQIAQALGGMTNFFADPAKESSNLATAMAKIRQDRAAAELAARAKDKQVDPLAIEKFKTETIGHLNTTNQSTMSLIDSVNRINAIGSDEAARANPYAQVAAQTILAKINDPTTGVKQNEYELLNALGIAKPDEWKASISKWAAGEGTLQEGQWEQLINVSNIMGKQAQEVIDEKIQPRMAGWAAAGVDPEVIKKSLPSYKAFDYKKAGWTPPKAIAEKQLAENELKLKQKENQDLMAALQKTGLTPEQIQAAVAAAKAKKQNVASKESPNGQKQTTK